MRGRTNLAALRALSDEQRRQQATLTAQQDREDAVLVVERAARWAAAVLGDRAAAALGAWAAVDVTFDCALQAVVPIAAGADLLYTFDTVDGREQLQLVASCPTCQHVREPRITSLLGLTEALQRQGIQ